MKSLQHLTELARRAYSGTSFVPETRATNIIAEFETMLNKDLESVPEYYQEKYAAKFEAEFKNWLHAKTRCISSMITGPARFPVERARKYSNWADGHYNDFMYWRGRILKALARSERKKTALTEFEKATNDLRMCRINHELMKNANAIIRKYKGTEACKPFLVDLGLDDKAINEILNPRESYYSKGYQTFYLTNNLANIKRLEERVKMLTKKEEMKATIETGAKSIPEITINGARIQQDYTDDRLKIFFDGKPAQNVINELKKSGFKWSPHMQCWCRKNTTNAVYAAKYICTNELKAA